MATVVAATAALALGAAAPALAQLEPIPWTGQGTEDGICVNFEEDDKVEVPEGKQAWHFILNQQGDPENATMDADFDDGTSVTGVTPTKWTSSVAHFYVITDAGAKLLSATAYPAGDQGQNPQFVVSHCVEGEKKPPETTPPTTTPPETTPPTENGEKPTPTPTEDVKTPKPVPTSVPAGYGDADNGSAGTIGLLAFATALAVGGAALVSRRFLKDN